MQYIDMPILSRRFRPIQRISRISDQPKDASPGAPDVFFCAALPQSECERLSIEPRMGFAESD
jgi:hypothetical protein